MSSKSAKMRDRSTSRSASSRGAMPRSASSRASTMSSVTGRVSRIAVRSASTRSPAGAEVEDQPPQTLAQRGAGLLRAAVAPEPRRQPLAALDLVGLQRDVDQHRHRLAAGDRRLAPADHQPRGRAGGDGDRDCPAASRRHITSAARRPRGSPPAPGMPRRGAAEDRARRPWRPRARRRPPARSAETTTVAPARQRGRECRRSSARRVRRARGRQGREGGEALGRQRGTGQRSAVPGRPDAPRRRGGAPSRARAPSAAARPVRRKRRRDPRARP